MLKTKTIDPALVERLRKHLPAAFGVPWEEVIGKGRTTKITDARKAGMHLLAQSAILQAVGEIFQVNHTSVEYARDTVENFLEVDASFRRKYEELKRRMNEP